MQIGVGGLCLLSVIGCQDLSKPTLPAGTQSPDTYLSRTGGLMLAQTAYRLFQGRWISMMILSGLLTDELKSYKSAGSQDGFDVRSPSEDDDNINIDGGTTKLYSGLHRVRGQAQLARAVLAEYAPDISPAVLGRLFAFEAYSELWLADMYCSGIPLSTIDYKGDFTNHPPSTTDQVYEHAITLFDSAIALSSDSIGIQTWARVGKARALLALAKYDEAEAAVANVQSTDLYRMWIPFSIGSGGLYNVFPIRSAEVADQEGHNGFAFRSSGDPRTISVLTAVRSLGGNSTVNIFYPKKYPVSDSSAIALASGTDAALIRAEAALRRGQADVWLSTINTLRTTGEYARVDTVYTDVTQTTILRIDTVWSAGTGGIEGLRPLTDPGTPEARRKLHFDERAAWLFLTGNRQGDLRRLVRKDRVASDDIYPIGEYSGISETGFYGTNIDIPIPAGEKRNPLFKGCLSRD
jgi:hypothetical protein